MFYHVEDYFECKCLYFPNNRLRLFACMIEWIVSNMIATHSA